MMTKPFTAVALTAAAFAALACSSATASGTGTGGKTTTATSTTTTSTSGAGGATTSSGAGGSDCALYVVPSGTDLTTPRTLSKDVMGVFLDNCSLSTCHGSASAPTGNLFLGAAVSDASTVHANLLGVKSNELLSMNLVTASKPEESWLMHKMDGDQCYYAGSCEAHICAAVMPNGNDMPLPAETRDIIRAWITQGAPDN